MLLVKCGFLSSHDVSKRAGLAILHNDPHLAAVELHSMAFEDVGVVAVVHDVDLCLNGLQLFLTGLDGNDLGGIDLFGFFVGNFVDFS